MSHSELVGECGRRAALLALLGSFGHGSLSELGPVKLKTELVDVGSVFRVAGRDPRMRHYI